MQGKEKPAYYGHRERVRQRIEESGFDNLAPCDLLEYILFFAIPRCDTYNLSRKLIKHFGSLKEVLCATCEELQEIKGIGPETALFIKSLIPIFKAYQSDDFMQKRPLTKMSDILTFLRIQVMGAREETVVVLYLDAKKTLIRYETFSIDDWSIVSVNTEQILRKCVSSKVSSVVIGHNHLTGKLFPSNEDIEASCLIEAKFSTIGVKFLDSIIFDEHEFYSFKENNII